MIILLALAAAASSSSMTPSADELRFETCAALVDTDPVKALDMASSWQLQGGGVLARQCAGLAYGRQQRWLPAATAFEGAARLAETTADGRAALLWVQAGNAALAAADPARARGFLDAALARGQLVGDAAGEAHLDRARACAAMGDLKAARADLDLAVKMVPADPLAWLLSAALARKMDDLLRARADIAEAAARSPDDATVALEAGNIALLSGHADAARTAWTAAAKNAPDSDSGKSAAEALAGLAR
ncbi:tetratricopeptide repeat protein [Sphingomonas sp.]|uniref:tetratricopeptide repeat protein n=1 Tax=Sphingomonas sp. TaxID=28214 RepID=UPI0025D30A9E|nr:tetratricopeptide repeat protein [Sphingomonas sp.]